MEYIIRVVQDLYHLQVSSGSRRNRMFCPKCGVQNADTAKFCCKCGNILNNSQNKDKKEMKKIYYIIGAVVISVALMSVIFLGIRGKKAKEYETYLASAEKYIEELNYEQAKDFYLKAIEIAPKQLKPYVKLAQVYVSEGKIEKALRILEVAETQHAEGSEETKIELKALTTRLKGAYEAYADKIMEYEAIYGPVRIARLNDWLTYLKGLCFMKLIDFDKNGQEELLLVYKKEYTEENSVFYGYSFEIWGYENEEIVMLDSGELFGTDGGVTHIYLTEVDGYTYVVSGGTDGFGYYYYHGYSENGFGVSMSQEWEDDARGNIICKINGERVSDAEFEREHEKWFGNCKEYLLVAYDTNYSYESEIREIEETKRLLGTYYINAENPVEQSDLEDNHIPENRDTFMSESEAIEYASDYWDYEEGDVSEESGFPIAIQVQDGPTEENPYYTLALRWLVENSHWSTIDLVHVNAYTGECSYP